MTWDGTVDIVRINPIDWSVTSQVVALPSNVLATTPPQVFTVTSDCYNVMVSGSDNIIYLSQNCGGSAPQSFARMSSSAGFVGGGPELMSSFSSSSGNLDVVYGHLTGDTYTSPLGGITPGVLFWQNGVQKQGFAFSGDYLGPMATVALGGGGVMVGRMGAATGDLFATTATNMFGAWSGSTQITTGTYANTVAGSPVIFSPDGQNADVFFSLGIAAKVGRLRHIRYNGTSWQAIQDLQTWVQ
jgi:hypothetical protein